MASTSTSSAIQPNTTLYINNLNDKINKDELRAQLFALFTTYGKLIDVVASKGAKMRGQAFLVFADLAGATSAMRSCEGMVFYDKPMHIDYAKAKSWSTLRREDPNFVPPSSANARKPPQQNGTEKRAREEDNVDGDRTKKRERASHDDDDDDAEEMEIDEDEEQQAQSGAAKAGPSTSSKLLCTNLPQEVTDDVLSVLFSQYKGFQTTDVTPSPTPKIKMAQVTFESADLATIAKEALDGFTLKKGWKMGVAFA